MCGSEGNYDDTYQFSTWIVTLNLRWRKSLQVQPASKQNHSAQIQTLPCILLLPLLFFQKFPDSPLADPAGAWVYFSFMTFGVGGPAIYYPPVTWMLSPRVGRPPHAIGYGHQHIG